MAQFSASARRRFARIGSGTSLCLRYRMPPEAERLPSAPTLSRAAKRRLKVLEYAQTHTVAQTCRHFDIARSTFYRWQARYDPQDLTTLEDRPSRPNRCRRPTWTAAQAEAVRQVRERYPRWGKDKLAVLLKREGITLSVSMIGRILADLKRRNVLTEPRVARRGAPPPPTRGRTRSANPRTIPCNTPAIWCRSTPCT
jgi:transposase